MFSQNLFLLKIFLIYLEIEASILTYQGLAWYFILNFSIFF